jgi:hypothetical protein
LFVASVLKSVSLLIIEIWEFFFFVSKLITAQMLIDRFPDFSWDDFCNLFSIELGMNFFPKMENIFFSKEKESSF